MGDIDSDNDNQLSLPETKLTTALRKYYTLIFCMKEGR